MTQDNAWMLVRSFLLIAGGYAIKAGWLDESQMGAAISAIGVLFVLAWQVQTKWGTKSVPAAVVEASKTDPTVPTIPTVSPATGKVQDGVS